MPDTSRWCTACDGDGEKDGVRCSRCGGSGTIPIGIPS